MHGRPGFLTMSEFYHSMMFSWDGRGFNENEMFGRDVRGPTDICRSCINCHLEDKQGFAILDSRGVANHGKSENMGTGREPAGQEFHKCCELASVDSKSFANQKAVSVEIHARLMTNTNKSITTVLRFRVRQAQRKVRISQLDKGQLLKTVNEPLRLLSWDSNNE
jgi:hypothetical protein